MTVIVVEGPDGAGKSTLIDNLRLSSDRHYVSMRRSGPPKTLDEIVHIIRWIERLTGPTPLILDRHPFISEDIYGNVLRGKSLLNGYSSIEDYQQHFRTFVDRIIYCRPPTSIIMQKMHDNPQLRGVHDKIEEITQQYDHTMKLIRHWGVRVPEYNWIDEHEADSWNLEQLFFGTL